MRPPCGDGHGSFLTTPGLDDVEGPQPRRLGLGDIERLAVGRQADAVRRDQRVGDLDDARAVALGVIDAADIHVARPPLAEIGEVDAAVRVADQIVRPAQLVSATLAVEHVDRAGGEVDPLEPSAAVILGLDKRPAAALVIDRPFEAAIVDDVALAVRADRGAVGAAAGSGDDRLRAVRRDLGQRTGGDLDQDHRAVGAGDGPFGELQPLGDRADVHRHRGLPDQAASAGFMCPQYQA